MKSEENAYSARSPKLVSLLDCNADLPLSERLYQRIRELILSGSLSHGSRLASSRALAASLAMSRNSALVAIERLIADGLLESRRGSGVYVSYSGPRVAVQQSPNDSKVGTSYVPFRLGWQYDGFPIEVWRRLQFRRWRQAIDSTFMRKGTSTGLLRLRRAIAAHVAVTRGIDCAPEQIVITTCGPSAIYLIGRALRLHGSEAWVEDPSNQLFPTALQDCGIRVAPIPVDADGIDIETGKRLAPHAKVALVTPSCQEPTGCKLSELRRRGLIQWAHKNHAWILEDDFNWSCSSAGTSPLPLVVQDRERTIYLNSFNHRLFPGLRIAYLITPAHLVDRFAVAQGVESDVNIHNQMVLADFMESGYLDDHLRQTYASCIESRTALRDAIERELRPFLTPHESSSSNYFVCTLDTVTEAEFVARCAENGIVISGMSSFRVSPSDREQIVLGFARYKPKAISDAVTKLRAVFEDLR